MAPPAFLEGREPSGLGANLPLPCFLFRSHFLWSRPGPPPEPGSRPAYLLRCPRPVSILSHPVSLGSFLLVHTCWVPHIVSVPLSGGGPFVPSLLARTTSICPHPSPPSHQHRVPTHPWTFPVKVACDLLSTNPVHPFPQPCPLVHR